MILYGRGFGKSAKRLAQAMGIRPISLRGIGSVARRGVGSTRRQTTMPPVAVAWGASAQSGLNSRINRSKLKQLQAWTEAGLSTLQFREESTPGWLPRSGQSYGGADFDGQLIAPSYWTKPILGSTAEYRVHVVRKPGGRRGDPAAYRVIRLGWKVNADSGLNRTIEGVQIKSRRYGWTLQYYSSTSLTTRLSDQLSLLARWAVAAMEWDFAALDVIKAGGKYFLVEANSAPGLLDDATRDAYADALREVIDAEGIQ